VKAHPDRAHFLGVRSETLVSRAEAALGVTFPASYWAFLLALGRGSFAGEEFYGIADEDFTPIVSEAIGLTLKDRQQWDMPRHFVIIGALGGGTMYALDTSRMLGDECPMVSMYLGEAPSYEASDFGDSCASRWKKLRRTSIHDPSGPARHRRRRGFSGHPTRVSREHLTKDQS
jgi:hypothetical protein